MITGNHPRCKWILIPPPYVHSFIWMTMYVPYHKDNISMAGPRGFVKIVRLYLLTTDIWICWFHRFAFVKPSYLHLQTSDINSSFGAALDFSQKKFCIFQVQSSAFSFRWYPHLSEPAVFFTAHQSDFTRPNHFQSTQKQCFLGKKRRFRRKNFCFWSRTVRERGVPPFSVNFFSLTFRENVVRDGPGGGVPP